MKKITLKNDFHNSSVAIMADDEMINDKDGFDPWIVLCLRGDNGDVAAKARASRIVRELCGVSGCRCAPVSSWEVVS